MKGKSRFTGWDTVDLNGNGQFIKAYYCDYGGQEWICVDENHVYKEYSDGSIRLVTNLKASQIGCKEFSNGGSSIGNSLRKYGELIYGPTGSQAADSSSKASDSGSGNGWVKWVAIGGGALLLLIILIIAIRK